MTLTHLISKLEVAAEKSLHFADQEKEKSQHVPYLPLSIHHHSRLSSRENFFRERYYAILNILEKFKEFDHEDEEDLEEIVYLARRLITEMEHVWIRRRALDEKLYKEIYKDTYFEPYTKGLPHQKENVLHSGIDVLGLDADLEKELYEVLLRQVPQELRNEYVPLLLDVVVHSQELQNLFKDDWTKKANLIRFRLFELGLL